MNLPVEAYSLQAMRWPATGRHILAHFDAASIVVYQAYKPAIADFALCERRLDGPDFSLTRMSWIKPNFMWMMHRSGWASKPDQEKVLALRIRRAFFDTLLESAVASSFAQGGLADHEAWSAAIGGSDVRLQWDPDHGPRGEALERKAIQLGLRGARLRAFAQGEIIEVSDMTDFARAQSPHAGEPARLLVPAERPYVPESELARRVIGLDAPSA